MKEAVTADRELQVLIDCARAAVEPERAERIREFAAAGLDWERVLMLARRHGIAPLLSWHLNRIRPSSMPAGARAFLHDYFQKNSALSLLLTGELLRLLKLLNHHGIDAMPYKGSAIAVKLYGHVALRQSCDVDILVRERDVWEAGRAIEAQGFAPQFVIPDERRAAFVRQDYVQLFHRDAGRTLIELHWALAPRSFSSPFDADAVWQRVEPMPLLGATVSMPCDEDLLLMLCIHGGKHGWDKLEAVAGIAELLRQRTIDWEAVWERSREMHARRMLVLGLLLAHHLFDTPLPDQVAALGRSRTLAAIARGVVRDLSADEGTPTFARLTVFHLRLKDSYADRARYCLGLALTPTPDDWAAIRLHTSLSFAYPLVRALRVARKRSRG